VIRAPVVAGALLLLTTAIPLAPPARGAQAPVPLPPKSTGPVSKLVAFWTADLPAPPLPAAACNGAQVYVALRNGRLVALSLTSGQQRWEAELAPSWAPAAGDGLVFVGAQQSILALSASDGSVQWRVPISSDLSAPLLWDTGWLLGGTEHGDLIAIRARDGEKLWQQPVGSPVRATPALAADRVYVSLADGRVVALELQTGNTVWERKLGDTPTDILALDDRLFVGSKDNYFYCLARKNGKVKWRWRTGGDIVGMPAIDRQRVYFLSLDNLLRALDRGNGNQRWKVPLGTRPSSSPIEYDGTLLVAGLTGEIRAYSAKDGAPAGGLAAPAEFAAPPLLTAATSSIGRALVVVTGPGQVVAYRPGDAPLISHPLPNLAPQLPLPLISSSLAE